jgi:hypothetical protein
LHDIFGRCAVAEQQVGEAQRRDLIARHQRLESADVTTLAATDSLAVVVIELHSIAFWNGATGSNATAVPTRFTERAFIGIYA